MNPKKNNINVHSSNVKNNTNPIANNLNIFSTKRFRALLVMFFFILILLVGRIAYLQFIKGSYLKELAYKQQSTNQIISPKRGTIYDSTGKKLAISSVVDTITINPTKITGKTDEATKAKKELVAKGLSEIFELNYEETLEKVNSTSSVQTIAKKVEQDKVDKLKSWMDENDIAVGINIDEDTKRTYPYNNLASNLIGFCGSENDGKQGIELKWNSVLTGTPGKIVTSQDAFQEEIPNTDETYIAAENGNDIVLTIDVKIQTIVEKYLKEAVEEFSATKGGTVIAMNPTTGDILAMASYPDYNLNSPSEPNDTLKLTWDTLTTDQKNDSLQEMWRNRLVSTTYEPGSPFKLITASVALEENITSEDVANDFTCLGHEDVNGQKVSCWSQNHKGSKTLRQALQYSCNPSFIQLGKRIGANTLYKYYAAFGLFNKTGIDLPSESNSIFFKSADTILPIELATMSFGQRINITPIQLVSAVSAIANDGVLMKPRIVKQVINTDTNTVTDIEPVEVRQVLSKSTSERMRELMHSVVTDGSGRTANISGYSIGGKTGTSEPPVGKPEEGYIASYIAIAPTEKPEICLLMALHDPKGKHQGGQTCGPYIGKMLSEILPYLGLNSSDIQTTSIETDTTSNSKITVPDIRNKTVTEAKKILQQSGLQINISVNGDENSLVVTEQVPEPGISVYKNSIVSLYTTENNTRVSVTVPDLNGLTLDEAQSKLSTNHLNLTFSESSLIGTISSQDIKAGSLVEEGTVIKVTLKSE